MFRRPRVAVNPEALAQGAADHAVEQRQVLREDQLCAVDDVLLRESLGEEVAERYQPKDAAVHEQHSGHAVSGAWAVQRLSQTTASSPGTIGRVRGNSPCRAMLPT